MNTNAKVVVQVVTNAEKAKKEAKQIGKKVAQSAEKGAKKASFGDKIKQNLDKIKIGVENIGIGGDKLSKLGQLFKGGGWIAAAAAAITLIAKGAMQLWDRMTISAEQMIAKGAALKQLSQEDYQKGVKQQSVSATYLKRLQQLNELQTLSNFNKMQAIAIIDSLTKTYGNLGLSISTVTGKVLGLDEALEKVNKMNQKKRLGELKKIIDANQLSTQGNMQGVITEWLGTWHDMLNQNFQKYFSEFQKDRSDVFAKGINAKFNESYVNQVIGGKVIKRQLTPQEKKQAKLWNNGGLQGKIQVLTEKMNNATTQKQIDLYSKAIAALKSLKDAKQKYNMVEKYGVQTEEQFLKKITEQNKQLQKLQNNLKKRQQDFKQRKQTDQENSFYSQLKPTSTKIAYKSVRKQQIEEDLNQSQKQRNYINSLLDEANKNLSSATQKKDLSQIEKHYKRVAQLTKKLAVIDEQILNKKGQIYTIEIQIEKQKKIQFDEDLKQLKNDSQKIKKLQKQLELQRKIEKEKLSKKVSIDDVQGDYDSKKKEILSNSEQVVQALKTLWYASNSEAMQGMAQDYIKQYEKIIKVLKSGSDKDILKSLADFDFNKLSDPKMINAKDYPLFMEAYQKAYDLMLKTGNIKTELLDVEKKLKNAKEINGKLDGEALKAKMQQLTIEHEINNLKKRSSEYYSNSLNSLNEQLEINKLILQGLFDQAEKQKLINDLKKQGIAIDNEAINKIVQKQKQLKNLQADKSLKDDALSLYDKLSPKNADTMYQQRMRKFKEQGIELNSDQQDTLRKLVQLEFSADNLPKLDLSQYQIKTNELTARGGFKSGVVMPESDRINMAIMNSGKSQVQILTQIKDLLSKMGWI